VPISLLGLYDAFCCRRKWLLIFAWGFLHSLAYWLLGISSYFWYYAPLAVAFIAATSLGFAVVWRWRRRLAWVIVITILLGSFFSLIDLSRYGDPRLPVYRAAGEWLLENTPKEASVGALEVGIIGFYAQRPMIDFAGLLQPEIATHMRLSENYQETANWAMEEYRPQYVVLNEAWSVEMNHGYLSNNCIFRQSIAYPKGHYTLKIYYCKTLY
jgi:hypothetical protein